MSRQALITALENHQGVDEKECHDVIETIRFLKEGDETCFLRTRADGHITGSALLMSRKSGKYLLMHHRYVKRWVQFGGHVDGNTDILDAAIRETVEESGIENVAALSHDIFDVDIHAIPANPVKDEGDHLHYDIRYLLTTDDENFTAPEGHTMKWLTIDELSDLDMSESTRRMIGKSRYFLKAAA